MTKLTLSVEKEVVAKAKRIAEERGTSVSAMFSEMVEALGSAANSKPTSDRLPPITRRTRGIAQADPRKTDRELYEEAILAKARK